MNPFFNVKNFISIIFSSFGFKIPTYFDFPSGIIEGISSTLQSKNIPFNYYSLPFSLIIKFFHISLQIIHEIIIRLTNFNHKIHLSSRNIFYFQLHHKVLMQINLLRNFYLNFQKSADLIMPFNRNSHK
jgi:hypothetical protein